LTVPHSHNPSLENVTQPFHSMGRGDIASNIVRFYLTNGDIIPGYILRKH